MIHFSILKTLFFLLILVLLGSCASSQQAATQDEDLENFAIEEDGEESDQSEINEQDQNDFEEEGEEVNSSLEDDVNQQNEDFGADVEDDQDQGLEIDDQEEANQQLVDDQMDNDQMSNEGLDDQMIENQMVDDQINNPMTDTQADGGQALNQVVDNQVSDNQMVDNQMVDNQMVDNQMVDNQMVDSQMSDNQMADQQGGSVEPQQSQVPPSVSEVSPVYHQLSWVGYEIDEDTKKITVSMITGGSPEFEVFQEQNRSIQPELVVRFFQSSLRKKIKWDIDASEFRSPIAYIRMREDKFAGHVDVVLTLRDPVEGNIFAKDGNVTLTFPIPGYYFGNLQVEQRKVQERAELLQQSEISLLLEANSESPRNMKKENDLLPEGQPIDNVISPEQNIDPNGLPDNFSSFILDSEQFVWSEFTILAVGQENAEEENQQEENQQEENQQEQQNQENQQNEENQENEQENLEQNQQENQLIDQEEINLEQNQEENQQTEQGVENIAIDQQQQNQGNFSDENLNSEKSENPVNGANGGFGENAEAEVAQFNLSNNLQENPIQENNEEIDVLVDELEPEEPNQQFVEENIEPSSNRQMSNKRTSDRLVYMEFTDAPLSLVFKSFSEETGNNFIFPNSVGDLTVSIHFKGVPWDEALKAILETHSLGMVRVGDNIVRVDAVDRLTTYLQTLERAQQFEARRAPTKILVFRLNNAKAADIVGRINEIVARDKQIDPRIQVSADARTNSVVMEAPDYVLAKTKSVIERLDLKTPQVEITSRIVEIQKTNSDLFGISWLNQSLLNFDPGRGLGFGSLNFPNSLTSSFAVDPGVRAAPAVGNATLKFGSINKFIDLDLLLRMEERRGTTNVLQSNRVLVLDGQEAMILAGNSKFFRPAAGGVVGGGGDAAAGGDAEGLSEVKFNLSLEVKPQVTADGSVIMDLNIQSDTPGAPTGEVLADKNTRELATQMVRESGDTGVIGGIYDTSKTQTVVGIPFLSNLPIIGALFRSTITEESQTELLIMVTPTIVTSDTNGEKDLGNTAKNEQFGDGNNLENVNF